MHGPHPRVPRAPFSSGRCGPVAPPSFPVQNLFFLLRLWRGWSEKHKNNQEPVNHLFSGILPAAEEAAGTMGSDRGFVRTAQKTTLKTPQTGSWDGGDTFFNLAKSEMHVGE